MPRPTGIDLGAAASGGHSDDGQLPGVALQVAREPLAEAFSLMPLAGASLSLPFPQFRRKRNGGGTLLKPRRTLRDTVKSFSRCLTVK